MRFLRDLFFGNGRGDFGLDDMDFEPDPIPLPAPEPRDILTRHANVIDATMDKLTATKARIMSERMHFLAQIVECDAEEAKVDKLMTGYEAWFKVVADDLARDVIERPLDMPARVELHG